MREKTKERLQTSGKVISAIGLLTMVLGGASVILGPVGVAIALGGLVIGGGLLATGTALQLTALGGHVNKLKNEGLFATANTKSESPSKHRGPAVGAWNILEEENDNKNDKKQRSGNETSIFRRLGVKKGLLGGIFSKKKNNAPQEHELQPLKSNAQPNKEKEANKDSKVNNANKPRFS